MGRRARGWTQGESPGNDGQVGLPSGRDDRTLSNPWVQGGDRWFRADHLVPDSGIILEADGAIKYNNRQDAAELINADRNRERLLRKAGFDIIRYTWNIANGHPAELLRRVREMERIRLGQPVPTCWTMQPPWEDHALRVG